MAILVAVVAWAFLLVALAGLSLDGAGLPPLQSEPVFGLTLLLAPLEIAPPPPRPLPAPPPFPVHEQAVSHSDEVPQVGAVPVQTTPEPPAEAKPASPDPAPAEVAVLPNAAELPALPDSPVPAPMLPVTVPITGALADSLAEAIKVEGAVPAGMEDPGLAAANAYAPGVPDNAPSSDTLGRLDAAIAKKLKYPVQARRRGIQGTVVLSIAADHSGRLTLCALEKSSGNKLLDEAGLKLLKGLFPFPGGFASAFQTRIAISYTLD